MNSASLIDLENNDKIFVSLNELRLRCLKKSKTHYMYFLQYLLPLFSITNALSIIEYIQLDRCQYFFVLSNEITCSFECDRDFFTSQIYEIIKSKLATSKIIYRLLTDRQTDKLPLL